MGFEMIVHNYKGNFIICRTLIVPGKYRVEEGKAVCLHDAFSWIKKLSFKKTIIEELKVFIIK